MAVLVLFGLLILVILALRVWADAMNKVHADTAALARARGVDDAHHWRAKIKGVKTPIDLTASDEADALRQLLMQKVDPRKIDSLERM